MIRRKRIRLLTEELLRENGIEGPPVEVEQIVASRGLTIRKERLHNKDNRGHEISGFIVHRKGGAIIGVNDAHPEVRQRFTLAHELGHFMLHSQGTSEVHIDRQFRNSLSSQGTEPSEREANLFAAELLMPQHFIAKDISEIGGMDIVNDEVVQWLADEYRVSSQAMLFRLANLGYLSL